MTTVKSTVTLDDSFCPFLSFEEERDDIAKLAKKFKLGSTPMHMEITLSPWLKSKLERVLALMEENRLMEVSFYSFDRDAEPEEQSSSIVLYDEAGVRMVSPAYEFCEGFQPKEAFSSTHFLLTVTHPFNRRVTVHLNVTNAYSEGVLRANFKLSDLGFPSKKFVPKTPE